MKKVFEGCKDDITSDIIVITHRSLAATRSARGISSSGIRRTTTARLSPSDPGASALKPLGFVNTGDVMRNLGTSY